MKGTDINQHDVACETERLFRDIAQGKINRGIWVIEAAVRNALED